MAEQRERIVLEVDEKGVATSVSSANREVARLEASFARAGQTAEQRLLAKIETLRQRMANDPMRLRELDALQQRVLARVAENADRAGGKFSSLGAKIKDAIQNPLQAAGNAAEAFATKLGTLGVVASGVVAGIAAIAVTTFNFAKSLAQLGDETEDTASRMGLSIRETEAFRFAMDRAGGDMGQLEGIMRKLSQEIEGGGKNLRDMKVEFRDTHTGAVRPMADVILELSRRLKEMPEGPLRNAAAIKVLGRSALEVLPDLMELEAGVDRFNKKHWGLSDEQVKRFAEYQKMIAELKAEWRDFAVSMKETVVGTVELVVKAGGPLAWLMKYTTPGALGLRGADTPTNNPADREMAETGGWGYGASMSRRGHQWQLESIRRNDAAVAARLASQPEERLAEERKKLDKLRADLATGVEYNAERFRQFDAQKRIVDGLEAEIEATKKLKQEQKEFAEGLKKLNDLQLSDTLSRFRGETGIWDRSKGKAYGDNLQQDLAYAELERGMRAYQLGRVLPTLDEMSPEAQDRRAAATLKGLDETIIRPREEADQRRLGALERERRLTEQIIQIRTGPGGELDAIEQIARLRIEYAEKEFAIRRDQARYDEQVDEARIDRVRAILELQRQRFDSLKSAAEGLIDAAFERSRSAGQAFGNMLKAVILTPVKEALATVVAGVLMPVMWGKDGRSGLLGGLLGIFRQDPPLKISTDINTTATDRNTVAIENLTARLSAAPAGSPGGTGSSGWMPTAAGVGALLAMGTRTVGGEVIGAGRAASAGLERLPSGLYNRAGIPASAGTATAGTVGYASRGMQWGQAAQGAALMGGGMLAMGGIRRNNPLMTIGGGAAMGYGLASTMGMTGYGGAIAGAGAGLAIAGLQRGGWSGVGMSTAGGALVGLQFGGPIGAAIGAGVGFVAGLIRLGIKGAAQKVIEKVQQAYSLKIDQGIAQQIVQIAKQNYGSNLDVAIRAPQVLELLQLYALATGQQFGTQIKARAVSMLERGGRLYQNPIYENGSALAYPGLPVAGGMPYAMIPPNPNYPAAPITPYAPAAAPQTVQVNLSLSPEQTLDVFEGRTVQVLQKNPRVVQDATYSGYRSNSNRRQTAAALLTPSTLTS